MPKMTVTKEMQECNLITKNMMQSMLKIFSIGQGGQETMQKSKNFGKQIGEKSKLKKAELHDWRKEKRIPCNKKDKNSISSQSAKKTSIRNRISKEQRQVVWSSEKKIMKQIEDKREDH